MISRPPGEKRAVMYSTDNGGREKRSVDMSSRKPGQDTARPLRAVLHYGMEPII